MPSTFGREFAAEELDFGRGPFTEPVALKAFGQFGQFSGLASFDALDARQGDMASKILLRLFRGEVLDCARDSRLNSKQPLLGIIDGCPRDTWKAEVREESNSFSAQLQR